MVLQLQPCDKGCNLLDLPMILLSLPFNKLPDTREVFNRVTEDKEFNDHFTYNEVSRGMHQRKRKSIPKIPKTILEMITALENGGKISEYYNCSVNEWTGLLFICIAQNLVLV